MAIPLKSASSLTLGFGSPNGLVEKLKPQKVASRLLLIMVRFLARLPHLLLVLPRPAQALGVQNLISEP
ncbi:hypothetical protein CUMW_191370 [Citrus unshiu]|uniref:Uncharacterized protein n=1 Tax=Citrus unshiu TaxID=55188 RepID=A0A2H5Q305_CITUN|nr:hypothetical protein CUMW_191370 [Citrus unshiu]